MLELRRLAEGDENQWLELRRELHPGFAASEHEAEMAELLDDPLQAAFGAFSGDRLVGFVEVSERPWGEGCSTAPVGWIENLLVARDVRRQGTARELMEAAAQWVRSRGLKELGSDVDEGNAPSLAGHLAWGFEETMRLVMFRRRL
jgi:aminoglycoside 6'-N-acetyltransferase I